MQQRNRRRTRVMLIVPVAVRTGGGRRGGGDGARHVQVRHVAVAHVSAAAAEARVVERLGRRLGERLAARGRALLPRGRPAACKHRTRKIEIRLACNSIQPCGPVVVGLATSKAASPSGHACFWLYHRETNYRGTFQTVCCNLGKPQKSMEHCGFVLSYQPVLPLLSPTRAARIETFALRKSGKVTLDMFSKAAT